MKQLQRYLFWILSRTALVVYSRFPVFGRVRGSVGIIRNKDAFLVIERNDGRGISFPGGLTFPWETAEQSALREIREETGLTVTKSVLQSSYYSEEEIPLNLSVFEIEAEGEPRASWEGTPRWVLLPELRARILPSQRPIIETLNQR